MSQPVVAFELNTSDDTNIVPTIVTVYRAEDGEICLSTAANRDAARRFEEIIVAYNGLVLFRIEGQHDLSTGDASVWVRFR